MSSSPTPVYTSQTGVESPEPTIVEPVVSKKIRVTDPTYGLKTGAALAKQKADRALFLQQKAEAIGRQHAREAEKKAARVADLDVQIARIKKALDSGTTSDEVKSQQLYDSLVAKRAALV